MTPPLCVTTLPPQEAYDYEWYRDRLTDRSLLEYSIAIRIFRAPLLAVPVGGRRRGGSYSVSHPRYAVAVREILEGRPGFPHLRLVSRSHPDRCDMVEWGDTAPRWDDAALGRFYGYEDAGMFAFVAEPVERRPKNQVEGVGGPLGQRCPSL
ncbi:hypothetical protein GCM10012280_65150 [Wenjunlia tyrosinilytica]|uniref:Uncharacterized protein n=2 Tax=Wenjunlia tyrosinilytica TaxID=1544741 RepID=A0A917ZZW1_9ACTN|nr:hypothetical protein GCM10012280_65150 [Wenjunlia tyrosinilytica]